MKKIILAFALIPVSFGSAMAEQVMAGDSYSLFLRDDGIILAWGKNSDGQLGDGTTKDRWTPAQVSGLSQVVSISAGSGFSEFALALKRDGTVWGWGGNYYGQLGDGTTEDRHIPVQVVGLSGVIEIGAGESHSLALKNDGTVWAWGHNSSGLLGDGTTTERHLPVQVVGLADVISISTTGGSLALRRDGTVMTWPTTNSLIPVQVVGLSNIVSICMGYLHALVLKRDGAVWAWGYNAFGELGDGNSGNTDYIFKPVQSIISGVIAIAAGKFYSLALTSYGAVYFYGMMGDNLLEIITSSVLPIPVDSLYGISSISSYGNGIHALALRNDGTVWAWGDNFFGQLGDGTNKNRPSPVQVLGLAAGGSGTVPTSVLAADFDGDGKADPMAVDTSGQWFFWHSSQSFSRDGPIALGMSGSPAAGDADGDGKGDMAVVDSSGTWYFWLSSRGYASPESQYLQPTASSPQPLLADFDGDSKADPTIVDSTGTWTVWLSGRSYESVTGQFRPSTASSLQPVAGDFDGDTKADPVMVAANGDWYVWSSAAFYTRSGPFNFGVTGKPVAGDFDGDRKGDPCIVDSSGNWNLFLSTAFYTRSGPWYLVLP